MSHCESFAPIINSGAKILILGSMPGRKSLDMQQYYAHPRNRFWRLMALLLEEEPQESYAARTQMLLRHGVALWDTLAFCERDGSLDSDIRDEIPNDICGLLGRHPGIRAVFCNGGKAASVFRRHFAGRLPEGVQVFCLHSTSPANARMDLAALAEEWRAVRRFL